MDPQDSTMLPTQETPPEEPRDAAHWAALTSALKVTNIPVGAVSLNVDGRRVVGPLQGFGQLWQKTYRVRLNSVQVTPTVVIKTWKEQFPTFWPRGNRFYEPLTGIAPGEVALLSLKVAGGMRLSTGVLVLYADDESFTLMTPQGHVLAGWITFSAEVRAAQYAASRGSSGAVSRAGVVVESCGSIACFSSRFPSQAGFL